MEINIKHAQTHSFSLGGDLMSESVALYNLLIFKFM